MLIPYPEPHTCHIPLAGIGKVPSGLNMTVHPQGTIFVCEYSPCGRAWIALNCKPAYGYSRQWYPVRPWHLWAKRRIRLYTQSRKG